MDKKYELLNDIRQRTCNVRFDEINKLMLLWEFEPKTIKEGVIYVHPETEIMPYVCKHKHKGQGRQLHQPYVKKCIKAIDDLIEKKAALKDNGND